MSVASSTCFCVVLCVRFCTGHFVMVLFNLYWNIYIVYNILSLNISLIYILHNMYKDKPTFSGISSMVCSLAFCYVILHSRRLLVLQLQFLIILSYLYLISFIQLLFIYYMFTNWHLANKVSPKPVCLFFDTC